MKKKPRKGDFSQEREGLVQRDRGSSGPPAPSPLVPRAKLLHKWEHHPALGQDRSPARSNTNTGGTLRLGVLRLLLHDLQNHLAGGGAALGGGVDADGFFGSSRVFFPVHIDPAGTGRVLWLLGTPQLLRSLHVPAAHPVLRLYAPREGKNS